VDRLSTCVKKEVIYNEQQNVKPGGNGNRFITIGKLRMKTSDERMLRKIKISL